MRPMRPMRPMRIIRSRTGCFTCRRRKKKCNEEKPTCSGCRRNRLDCHWPAELASPSVSRTVSAPSTSSTTTAAAELVDSLQRYRQVEPKTEQMLDSLTDSAYSEAASPSCPSDPTPGSDARLAVSPSLLSSPSSVSSFRSPASRPTSADGDTNTLDGLSLVDDSGLSAEQKLGVPVSMSLLPSHDHDSFELLSYYLSRTANSMGNGSTDVNPFVAKLVPLAFSNPLVLQLILAQSAAHRQASNERLSNNEIAQRYYTDSLRMFRHVVGEYVVGKDGNMLILTVGSLIMCLTEVARGDRSGTIFDHLTASKSLLTMLLNCPYPEICEDLPDFLVEYYMHMAASSMISTDSKSNSRPLLSPEIEGLARVLLEKKYVGQLCGSWLQLLLLIPQIFQLGQRMLATADVHPVTHSADDIISFGLLQSQILAFIPDPTVHPDAYLAGLVFKQAVLLYLWSILGAPQQETVSGSHRQLMESAVSQAISLLSQLPASVRVNTSLCWPLAVIGCCTSDPAVQQVLRTRLQTMLETIGLGNMRETLVLLEHVWKQSIEETSPWTLFRSMQKHRTWISFA